MERGRYGHTLSEKWEILTYAVREKVNIDIHFQEMGEKTYKFCPRETSMHTIKIKGKQTYRHTKH